MSVCPRCTGKDGAHYMECVVGRLFERLFGSEYPWRAPIATLPEPEPQLMRDLRSSSGARERLIAALPESLGPVGLRHPAIPSLGVEASLTGYGLALLDALLPVVQPLVAEGQAEALVADAVDSAPAPEERTPPTKSAPPMSEDVLAAVELFVQERLEKGDPDEILLATDLAEAYEEFRPTIDGPEVDHFRFGRALRAAGLTERRRAVARDGLGHQRWLYQGWHIKGQEPERGSATPPSRSAAQATRVSHEKGEWARWVAQFAEECLILGENGPTDTPFTQRRDWLPNYALCDAYNEWREKLHPEAPEATHPRLTTMGMGVLGYKGRQAFVIGGSKPIIFFGVTLRPKANWGQPRASETAAAADKEDHGTGAIRALMKQAKAAKPESVVAREQDPATQPAPGPQVEATNNGWNKTWTTDQLARVTVDNIAFEEPEQKRERGYRYDGPRPGKELPKEYKTEVVDPLLEIPGWRYAPHNARGRGKPRIFNPQGQMLCLPNTPSDVKGLMASKTMLRNSLGAPL